MKKNIALLAGGDSGEFEISINSAGVVENFLDKNEYNTFKIIIKGRDWYYFDKAGKRFSVNKDDFSLDTGGATVNFDCAFIAIHGTPGEDGRLQAYLDIMGIPYTTCNHTVSAITFNKYYSDELVASWGIPTGKSLLLYDENNIDIEIIRKEIGFPCFVKPNQGGSSIGTSRVDDRGLLQQAIATAFKEDSEVIVQRFIDGREVTCGIIDTGKERHVFPLTEIVSKNNFFDYEAKYTDGMAEEITPARINEDQTREVQKISSLLYDKLRCSGLVRFDYIIENETINFLEVNTVPGLTENSIVPRMAKAYGMNLSELFSLMIESALDKG